MRASTDNTDQNLTNWPQHYRSQHQQKKQTLSVQSRKIVCAAQQFRRLEQPYLYLQYTQQETHISSTFQSDGSSSSTELRKASLKYLRFDPVLPGSQCSRSNWTNTRAPSSSQCWSFWWHLRCTFIAHETEKRLRHPVPGVLNQHIEQNQLDHRHHHDSSVPIDFDFLSFLVIHWCEVNWV